MFMHGGHSKILKYICCLLKWHDTYLKKIKKYMRNKITIAVSSIHELSESV